MDFVKREDQNVIDDDYKFYVESLQKTHQLEAADYQHPAISMEQLHQAMQSTVANSIVHNFQLPLSPRQMSSLMLKTNHLPRNLNFNDIPAHLPRNLASELDLVHNLTNDLPQNRHDDILSQNFSRNLDLSLVRSLGNDIELQNNLNQLAQNLNENLSAELSRINDLRADIPHDLSHEIDLSHHLNREQQILNQDEARRAPMVQCDSHMLDQNLGQRMVNTNLSAERLEQPDHILPMPFHIKSEQEDDGYFYENINQGINDVGNLNGIPPEHTQPQPSVHTDNQLYAYNVHVNLPALNSIDLYSRSQNYAQNFTNIRENPQNLVVHRQFDNNSPYQEDFKKLRQDGGGHNGGAQNGAKEKVEHPKENLKPSDQNKIYYAEYNPTYSEAKNENDAGGHNKIAEDISMNIKGQYACYKCNEVFPSKRGLKHHSKSCTENDQLVEKIGKFSCSQCAYRCQSPAILKIHERTHSGEKPFSCTFCDYKSGQKNNVAKHILVHMKEKPFRCQYCDYRCAQKNNLVVHERTHTGYKPFACPFCDYRTVQKPNLVKHMYLHTDQKPFSCDMCSYRCVQKTNLTKHKLRHLNEKDGDKVEVRNQLKPYRPRQKSVKCPHCAYRCVQKSSMEKHLQFKHGQACTEPFEEEQGVNLMKETEYVESINLCVKKDNECQVKDSLEGNVAES